MSGARQPGPLLRAFDIIENSVGFDADWYAARFADVGLSGLDGKAHYEAFGFALGRGVSADAPLIREAEALFSALTRAPKISYCTPIMNRPDDIRNTLEANLAANAEFRDAIEFLVIFADEDTATHDWVRENFAAELAEGYLRMIVLPPLDGWHFGRAKNLHQPYARGEIYSSLDGDNFVTAEETRQLLDVAEAQPGGFIFHHFTGQWGDGSSGRISLPMKLYRSVGYDPLMMPRQFDEIDVIISVMNSDKSLPLIRLDSNDKGFGSERTRRFLRNAGIRNPVIMLAAPERRAPLNPKSAGYVGEDPSLAAMSNFNQALCFLRNAPNAELRAEARAQATTARHQLIEALAPERILPLMFHSEGQPQPGSFEIGADEVCVAACMKNDDIFLDALYDHYKARGVSRFFIVDDGSDQPIASVLDRPDVHVFRPKVGSFATSKGMWIEGLLKAYLPDGHWALTIDADEFIDLPEGYADFPALVAALAAEGLDHLPGVLVDMVPGPEAAEADLARAEADFERLFDHFVSVETPPDADYLARPSVQWGFGPRAALSWRIDTRFHAFGTFDTLRKVPLVQLRARRHIDQGFHSLHYTDGTPAPGAELWDTDMALPIRHYKLLKLFSEQARARMSAQVASAKTSQYHDRTTANIARIFGDGGAAQTRKLMSLPSRPYADSFLRNLKPRDFSDVQAAGRAGLFKAWDQPS